ARRDERRSVHSPRGEGAPPPPAPPSGSPPRSDGDDAGTTHSSRARDRDSAHGRRGVDSIPSLPSSSYAASAVAGVDVDRDAGEGHAVRSASVGCVPGRLWPDDSYSLLGLSPSRRGARSIPRCPPPGLFGAFSLSPWAGRGPSRPSISARRLLLSGGLTKLWELACFRLV
ncbi:hypothetical protein THAOC_17535, partial [Thalassiosira oceanica]